MAPILTAVDTAQRGSAADAVGDAVRGSGRREVDGAQPRVGLETPAVDGEATVAAAAPVVVGRVGDLEADEHELREARGEGRGVGHHQRGRRRAQAGVAEEHLEASPAGVVDDPRADLVAVPQVHRSGGVSGDAVARGGRVDAVLRRVEGDLEREREGAVPLGGGDRVGEEQEGEAGGGPRGGGGGEEEGGGEGGVGGEREREREEGVG